MMDCGDGSSLTHDESQAGVPVIRLIALDLDGTLFGPDWRVGEADEAALIAARDRGVQISLATSRWYGSAHGTAERFELRAPLICQNGAHVKEPNDGAELLHLRIPTEVAREIAAFCDEGGFETYTTVDGVTYLRTPRAEQMEARQLPAGMRLAQTHAEFVTGPASARPGRRIPHCRGARFQTQTESHCAPESHDMDTLFAQPTVLLRQGLRDPNLVHPYWVLNTS